MAKKILNMSFQSSWPISFQIENGDANPAPRVRRPYKKGIAAFFEKRLSNL